MPLGKVHELAFLWFGLLGPFLIDQPIREREREKEHSESMCLQSTGFWQPSWVVSLISMICCDRNPCEALRFRLPAQHQVVGRSFLLTGRSFFAYGWSLLLAVNWLGLFTYGLVFFAYGENWVWSFLLMVTPVRKLVWSFLLTVPPQ